MCDCHMQMLMEDHDGVVPQTFEALEQLPGVGHKTASVVICTAFGYVPALPGDHLCTACTTLPLRVLMAACPV